MNPYQKLLQSIPSQSAANLRRIGRVQRFRPGESVASFGSPVVASVNRGWFRLSRFDRYGRQRPLALRRQGQLIGLEAAVGADVVPPEVVAVGAGELVVWPVADFASLLQSDQTLAHATARSLAEHAEWEAEFHHQGRAAGLGPRLAQLLLLFAAESGEPTSRGYQVRVPFNQHELAELLEVRRETVSIKLCQLENAGLIERCGRDLIVDARRARVFLAAADLPDDLAEREQHQVPERASVRVPHEAEDRPVLAHA